MQMEWLRALAWLKETMSFTEAAERMFVSQSSFSKYIKALENEWGVMLIDRSRKGWRFTPAGEQACPDVIRILEEYDGMLDRIRDSSLSDSGRVRISVAADMVPFSCIRRILDFFREHPELNQEMYELDRDSALRALEKGELDLMIGYAASGNTADAFDSIRLRDERLYYVGKGIPGNCGRGDIPEEEGGSISLPEIFEDRLILHQNMLQELNALLHDRKLNLPENHPFVTTTSTEVLKAYLQGGNARSLLTGSFLEILDPGGELTRLIPEGEPALRLEVLCRKKELKKPAWELIRFLKGEDL